jgi:hypothetical protein
VLSVSPGYVKRSHEMLFQPIWCKRRFQHITAPSHFTFLLASQLLPLFYRPGRPARLQNSLRDAEARSVSQASERLCSTAIIRAHRPRACLTPHRRTVPSRLGRLRMGTRELQAEDVLLPLSYRSSAGDEDQQGVVSPGDPGEVSSVGRGDLRGREARNYAPGEQIQYLPAMVDVLCTVSDVEAGQYHSHPAGPLVALPTSRPPSQLFELPSPPAGWLHPLPPSLHFPQRLSDSRRRRACV